MGSAYTHKRPIYQDIDDRDDLYETRTPSSARRYKPQNTMDDPAYRFQGSTTLVQRRRAGTTATNTADQRLTGSQRQQLTGSQRQITSDQRQQLTGSQRRITSEQRQLTGSQRQINGTMPAKNASKIASRTIDYNYPQTRKAQPKNKSGQHFFVKVLIIGMVVAVALIIGMTFVSSWWQNFYNDWRYGNPRTSQMDVVVGHNDSETNKTHLIFINLHGQVEFIEIPGGDSSHLRIFTGPVLGGADKDTVPVTGTTQKDAKTGMTDIIVHVGDQEYDFVNTGTTFALKS